MRKFLKENGYTPAIGKTHVFFDACVYRNLVQNLHSTEEIIEKARYQAASDKEKDYTPSAFSLVLWELISHLTDDKNSFDYKSCRKALIFAATHVKDESGLFTLEPMPELGIAYEYAKHCENGTEFINKSATTPLLLNSEEIGLILNDILQQFVKDEELSEQTLNSIQAFSITMQNRFKGAINRVLQCSADKKPDKHEITVVVKELFSHFCFYAVKDKYRNPTLLEELYPTAFAFVEDFGQRLFDASNAEQKNKNWCSDKDLANNIIDAMHLTVVADRPKDNQSIFVTSDTKMLKRSSLLSGKYDRLLSWNQYQQI